MTDAVIYTRVSSKEQEREGYSIDAQLRLLREYADEHDFSPMRVFIEVETAKAAGREVFQEMLDFIHANPDCRTILVEKTDRLYRNIKDWVIIDDLEIDIHFVKEGMIVGPNARSNDKFFHGIKVLMAKNYIDNLGEETRKGMTEKVLSGGWPHPAPIGYLNVSGELEPDPERSKIIRWLYHRYAAGDISVGELAKLYRESDFEYKMARSTIYLRLRDPFYKGVMRWKGDLYPGKYEPLVGVETWDRVQGFLDLSMRATRQETKSEFTYRGLLTCDHCGCAIVAEIQKGKYIYYHCTQNKGPCKENGYIRQEELDRQFAEDLKKLLLPQEAYQGLSLAMRDLHDTEIRQREHDLATLNEDAKSIRQKLDTLTRAKLNRDIKSKEWRPQHDELVGDLNLIYAKRRLLKEANLEIYEVIETLLQFTKRAEEAFNVTDKCISLILINFVYSNSLLRSGTLMNTTKKPFSIIEEGLLFSVAPRLGLEPRT